MVLVSFVGAGGLCLLSHFRGVAGKIEAHRVEIASLLEELAARSSTRPAILEPAEPGNAWDLLRPALDEVGELYPLDKPEYFRDTSDADLDWRGIPADTPQLIERATPALEQCRRAMHRSSLGWTGPIDPWLPSKVGRIGRALCTKAIQAWEQGRDAEAAEWLVVAMGVAQDGARLGQRHSWNTLRIVERWACQEARLMMGGHDLTLEELGLLSRRLHVLRSIRPPFSLPLREAGALVRQNVLDGDVQLPNCEEDSYRQVGWKDLYSVRLRRLRILNGLRRGVEEFAALDPTRRPSLESRADAIRSRYPAEDVAPLLPDFFVEEDQVLCRLERFRLAVEFARAKAESGRYPQQLRVDGVPVDLGDQSETGILFGEDGHRDLELVWIVGRRTKD